MKNDEKEGSFAKSNIFYFAQNETFMSTEVRLFSSTFANFVTDFMEGSD
jgi:hypothetical protein